MKNKQIIEAFRAKAREVMGADTDLVAFADSILDDNARAVKGWNHPAHFIADMIYRNEGEFMGGQAVVIATIVANEDK